MMPTDERGDVALGSGNFNPPTIALDGDGQGVPYATYGFAAQFAEVEVDLELGSVRVIKIHAAHDVGRAINLTQVEGQIHGGIAQGLGLALMEEYLPGKTDNLHDYLIPTMGDIPPITVHLVEDPEPLGPYGAKGVGEPALVATAPAILNAIRHATGGADQSGSGDPVEDARRPEVRIVESMNSPAKIVCNACPVLCQISAGRSGACDRYANVDGVLTRVDPVVLLKRGAPAVSFPHEAPEAWSGELGSAARADDLIVTGVGAGTTYPDYQAGAFYRLQHA